MKYQLLAFVLLFWTTSNISGQNFEWAKSFGGSSFDTEASSTVDANGNVYTTGWFVGTGDFDPGVGTAVLTSVGNDDAFIQKLDASGNFLWAKSFGGSESDIVHSIAVDASGSVYTTGIFEGTADFDPGAGTADLTSAGGTFDYDVFIQKLDASGNFVWAKSFGSSTADVGNSIAIDASGNIFTTGRFQGTVDFNPGAGTANLTSNGSDDVFIQKLDASGNFVWAKSFGGSSFDFGSSIVVDASGNVYATGVFQETVDFDPGAGTFNFTSTGGWDTFIQKLDASGSFIWARSFGGSESDEGTSIAVDASGNVHTTGFFDGTVDFDPGLGTTNLTSAGDRDVFVQKLDASGIFLWAKSFGGSSEDNGWSITVDTTGNVYTTGQFRETVDFDPGPGTANLTSAGWGDVYVQKLNASGNFIWAKAFGGNSNDNGGSITTNASGNLYTTGTFYETADFDPGTGTANLTSAGIGDVFVQKMSQGTTGILELAKGIQIKAFPNPSKGLVQLTFEQALSNVEITLTDLQGKVVFTKHLDAAVNEQINIDSSAGIYFLNVRTPDGQGVVKLIKE